MHGREQLLYSVKPNLDRFNAGWFAAAGLFLLALGVAIGSWVALASLLCFGIALLSWKRASWTTHRTAVVRIRRPRPAGGKTLAFEPYPGEPVLPDPYGVPTQDRSL